MTLTTTIETNGTTIEVDLDELNRYGQYYIRYFPTDFSEGSLTRGHFRSECGVG